MYNLILDGQSRDIIPKLLAKELCSVQPMKGITLSHLDVFEELKKCLIEEIEFIKENEFKV